MIPGFPGGKPCARCLIFWALVIAAIMVGYYAYRSNHSNAEH